MVNATLPRAIDPAALRRDIFSHVADARARFGPRVVVHDGALFSRSSDCPGVVAMLDPADVRTVLSDPARFPLPRSGALAVDLPKELVALNRSLHSLPAQAHRAHRTPIAQAVTAIDDDGVALVENAVARYPLADAFPLMATMRSLTTEVAARLIFGDDGEAVRLGGILSAYFARRREATAIDVEPHPGRREDLIAAGREAAAGLQARIGRAKAGGSALIDRLAAAGRFDAEDLAGHLNILYISSSEPLAAVLGWTLLILTQSPGLAAELHDAAAVPDAFAARIRPVLLESMRLLTPNALMTRIVGEPVAFGDCRLPIGTEVLLAPLVMHRDPAVFAMPNRFDPARWHDPAPGPFRFLPFGAGAHACIGRNFAMSLLVAMLRALVPLCPRPALDHAEHIDWRMAIVFQPAGEILLRRQGSDFPEWRGPASKLVEFSRQD